ncbi:flavodoxin [Limosilactobacillus fermentum]
MATTLVLYFSASGTTKRMAQTIANLTGADLHEIKAQYPYTQADLDWHAPQSRTSIEQHEHQGHVPASTTFRPLINTTRSSSATKLISAV